MDSVELQVSGLSEDVVLDIVEQAGFDNYGALDDWNVETWMGTVWVGLEFYDLDNDRVVLEDLIYALEDQGARVGSTIN